MNSLSKCGCATALMTALCLFTGAPLESLFAQANTAPPILEVETKPGNVNIFVDGIPMGRTNREGRLRLTRLARGLHTVRLAHEGYRNYTHDLQLEGGQVVPLIVELQKLRPGERASGSWSPRETSSAVSSRMAGGLGATSVDHGVLRGLIVRGLDSTTRASLGAGGKFQGVVISEVKADSPCGAARLQKNDVIAQVNRRPVRSPREFLRLASEAGGEAVLRVYRHGQAQLVVVSESQ